MLQTKPLAIGAFDGPKVLEVRPLAIGNPRSISFRQVDKVLEGVAFTHVEILGAQLLGFEDIESWAP